MMKAQNILDNIRSELASNRWAEDDGGRWTKYIDSVIRHLQEKLEPECIKIFNEGYDAGRSQGQRD